VQSSRSPPHRFPPTKLSLASMTSGGVSKMPQRVVDCWDTFVLRPGGALEAEPIATTPSSYVAKDRRDTPATVRFRT